jgi:hypothetical protein
MRKNIAESGRPQMRINHMRIARWISKAKHVLRICNTYCFSLQRLLQERASVLCYVIRTLLLLLLLKSTEICTVCIDTDYLKSNMIA